MTGSIVLKREVAVLGWRAIGEVARASERGELDPILRRAREAGGTDAEDVAAHLLFADSHKVVAERLLRIGGALGLLKEVNAAPAGAGAGGRATLGLSKEAGRKYALTESGERAIETGRVFVPERGAWTLWASEDPLLASPILGVDAWHESESALDETRNREGQRQFVELPDWVRGVQGKEIAPPASGDGGTIRVDTLEEMAEKAEPGGSLNLIWSIGDNRLRLGGTWDGRAVDSPLPPPDISSDEIWEALLESAGMSDDWDSRRRVLRVSFEDANEAERETMARDLGFAEPSVPGYGTFDSVTVSGTAIAARSGDDADRWSAWRLNARIRDFATGERYRAWWEEASAPFAEHRPECPARAALAVSEWDSSVKRPSSRAWYLVAAEDWAL